jgi:hypothetical protein
MSSIYTGADRRTISAHIAWLGVDQVGADRMLADIESAAQLHLLRSAVFRTIRKIRWAERVRDQIAKVDALRNEAPLYLATDFPTESQGVYRGNLRLAALNDRVLERMQQHLAGVLAAIGDPGPRAKTNRAKSSRDLFWQEVADIWTAAGGKPAGKQLAEFLLTVTAPLEKVPKRSAAVGWLDRRSKMEPPK